MLFYLYIYPQTRKTYPKNLQDLLKILVCPLDWGLGHATRCVPVIDFFRNLGHMVLIAGDGRSLIFLKNEFPDLVFMDLPGYNIRYPKGRNMALKMAMQMPAILKSINSEKKATEKIVDDHSIDVIISDNRFGCRSAGTINIYMTHQVKIKAPYRHRWTEPVLYRMHNQYINKFDYCWIPDYHGEDNLSGGLSHGLHGSGKFHFIGPLSRFFSMGTNDLSLDEDIDILAIISGPEPQRSIFQEILTTKFLHMEGKFSIVAGKPENGIRKCQMGNITMYDHLGTMELQQLIKRSKMIVCRSGYSSVMDLVSLKKKALLIPTPGQTEQEYLSKHLRSKGLFECMDQQSLKSAKLPSSDDLPVPSLKETGKDLLLKAWKEIGKS